MKMLHKNLPIRAIAIVFPPHPTPPLAIPVQDGGPLFPVSIRDFHTPISPSWLSGGIYELEQDPVSSTRRRLPGQDGRLVANLRQIGTLRGSASGRGHHRSFRFW